MLLAATIWQQFAPLYQNNAAQRQDCAFPPALPLQRKYVFRMNGRRMMPSQRLSKSANALLITHGETRFLTGVAAHREFFKTSIYHV